MPLHWRRGCLWLLVALLGTLLLVSATVGTGIAIAVSQPRRAWHIPLGSRSLVIGEIVANNQCRHMQEAGVTIGCARQYGMVLYLPRPSEWGRAADSYTLLAIPNP